MQKAQVQSLGWEDPLGKGMVTYSSILAWRIPWTEEPGGLQSLGSQRVGHFYLTITFLVTPPGDYQTDEQAGVARVSWRL